MGIGMRFTHRHTTRQTVEQHQHLAQEQRFVVGERLLALRLQLILVLRGVRYDPKATCPSCHHRLTPLEIVRGFRRDPNDYSTECPRCHHRFEPKLFTSLGVGASAELPFFCPSQTIAQLTSIGAQPVEVLQLRHQAVYHSALTHFGSLTKAYQKAGITYAQTEVPEWQKKILPFLGKLPDTVIAACAEVTVTKVRRIRHNLKIPRWSGDSLLKTVGVESV